MTEEKKDNLNNIINTLKERIDILKDKPDEFSKKELKILFGDVFDSIVYILELIGKLPEEMVNYVQKSNKNFYDERFKNKQKEKRDPFFYS